MKVRLILLFSLHYVTSSRDFYVGMFKRDDLLVATDTLYKERVPYSVTRGMYGRLFKCNITYFRVVDRLGAGRVPRVEITRGGLQKKFVVLRITSGYDLPLSVNIYVGCQNKYNFKRSTHIIRPTTTKPSTARATWTRFPNTATTAAKTEVKKEGDATTPKADGAAKPDAAGGADKPEGDATTPAGEGETSPAGVGETSPAGN